MNKSILKKIILEQKNEINEEQQQCRLIERKIENELKKSLSDNLIKVIIGVRRSGKSVLAHHVLKDKKYGYVNFDDERLINFNSEQLDFLLETLLELNDNLEYILLDEIQNISGWELFVNRLKRQGYKIVVTGSNSKLLSKELSTHLTGRHLSFELFPFSFQEFLEYKNIKYTKNDFYLSRKRSLIRKALGEYFQKGSFPEIFNVEFGEKYLLNLYKNIINEDIVARYNIKYAHALREIAIYVFTNFASKFTYHKLSKIFEIKSVHTIKNYLDYLEEAYLIFQVHAFSYKLKNQFRGAKKIYGIDHGLIQSVSAGAFEGNSKIMENIVFLELMRRGKEVFYYTDRYGNEVDFVVRDKEKNKINQLIQVSYNVDDEQTYEREVRSLISSSKELKCDNLLLITYDLEDERLIDGVKIKFLPLDMFLLF